MQHDLGEAEEVFRHEVAVGDGIDGAIGDVVEFEEFFGQFAVDGEGSARERRAAEGHDVDALAAVFEPIHIAQEHLRIGVEVLCEVDGLGLAQVGVSRKDALDIVVRDRREGRDEVVQQGDEPVDGAARIQPQVGRDLVVARARRVQLFAHFADALHELVFDEGVDVLRAFDGKRSPVDVLEDAFEPFADEGRLFGGDDVRLSEHSRVGDAGGDVNAVKFLVKGERFVEGVGVRRGGSVEPSFPKFHYITSQMIVCILDFTWFSGKRQAF